MYAHEHGTPGDVREFDDLYERYQPRLVRYCQQRLRSAGDAEDAAHEAFLRALQAWSRLDRTLDAWPWLATIAGRVCADMRRRSARTTADAHDEPASDVHDLAVARLRASIIDDALDRLPARYRNSLVLKEFAGWTYRDIARLEGTSVASVRSTIMRGRRYLGARVEEVARTQGQWPLPVIVPGVADRIRHRLRNLRQGLLRAFDPTMVVTGLALVMKPALAAGAAPAAAVVVAIGAVTPAAAAPVAPHTTPQAEATRPTIPAKHTTVLLETNPAAPADIKPMAAARETLSRIDEEPIQSSYLRAGASLAIQTTAPHMWLEVDVRYSAPVVGDRRSAMGASIPCGTSGDTAWREACRTAGEVIRPLPD